MFDNGTYGDLCRGNGGKRGGNWMNGGGMMEKTGSTQGLKRLIERGPNPSRGLTALILKEYSDITEARAIGWGWAEVADALGKPGMGKKLAKAFYLTTTRIQTGKLKPHPKKRIGTQLNVPVFKGFSEL